LSEKGREMSFALAFIACATGTAGLFYLDRDKSQRISWALWLPVFWLLIIGSRPVSAWIGIWTGTEVAGAATGQLESQLDGSPVDAAVFFLLLIGGIFVLARRKKQVVQLLQASVPILLFFCYTVSSVLWSKYPEAAFKRWTKDVGELAMVLIIVTEFDPVVALRRIFSRVGFILLPASVLLIRYSDIGRGYDPDGHPMNTGVTTNKNTLGLITFFIALGAVWGLLHALRDKGDINRRRHLITRAVLLAFAVTVLYMAHSATSVACFGLGTVLILATISPIFKRRPSRLHGLVFTILLSGVVLIFFGGESLVIGALGRDSTLTGRTDIWNAVIPMCPNPLIGAGFESFWNSYGGSIEGLSRYQQGINSAHNGYIEVYLNLGWVGIVLISIVVIDAYRRSIAAFRRSPEIAGLMLAYVATAAIYSITEAGFRILTPTWISVMLATMAGTVYASGRVGSRVKKSMPLAVAYNPPVFSPEK